MDIADVSSRIRSALDLPAQIDVQGADCNFTARVVSDAFNGLRPVQRQQKVLAAFADLLADGRLHALTLETYTAAEWQARSPANLTQLV